MLHDSEASDHVSYMVAPPQYMQMVHRPSALEHSLYPGHSAGETQTTSKALNRL